MSPWSSLVLTGALTATAPTVDADAGPGPPEVTARRALARVRLDVDDALYPALADALSLRLVGVEVEPFGPPSSAHGDGPQAYVRIRGPRDDVYVVSIVVSDGRAYDREVVAPEAMAARIVGSELAVLLRGIEEETLRPDRKDATIPTAVEDGEAVQEPAADPLEPATDPGPDDTTGAEGTAIEGRELGIRTAPGGSLALAPAHDIAESGVGTAMLGLDLRWASGATLSADLRMGGRRSVPYGIVRTRVAIGGGVVVRRGAFEMPVLAQVGLEPWSIRSRGRGTAVHPIDGSARQVPLLGVIARAAPGVRVSIAGRPSMFMRVGPFVELAASAVFSDGVGAPRLHDAETGEVVARLGGLELGLGICAELWLGLPPARDRSVATTP